MSAAAIERTHVMDVAAMLRALPQPGRATFLYFIQEDGDNGYVKVGVSKQPETRIRVIRTHNPRPINVLGVFCVNPFAEKDVHRMLKGAGALVRGEWFRPVPLVFNLIAAYREAGLEA